MSELIDFLVYFEWPSVQLLQQLAQTQQSTYLSLSIKDAENQPKCRLLCNLLRFHSQTHSNGRPGTKFPPCFPHKTFPASYTYFVYDLRDYFIYNPCGSVRRNLVPKQLNQTCCPKSVVWRDVGKCCIVKVYSLLLARGYSVDFTQYPWSWCILAYSRCSHTRRS